MAMWYSFPVNNFIIPVINIQIGHGGDFLSKLIDFIDYDVENSSIGDEVAHNTLVTDNQAIEKSQQEHQILDFNDAVMLIFKDM